MKVQSQTLSQSQPSILWLSVWALAAVQGAFTFGWVIYRIHLPEMLTQFGFSADFAPTLLLIEALLAIAVEPLAGFLSDRNEQHGHRFLLIRQGAALAVASFVLIPILVLTITPSGAVRWGLMGLLIGWAIAMSWFRTPALALLKRCTTPLHLPQAASLLTLAGGLAGATLPLANQLVFKAGLPLTAVFAAGILAGAIGLLGLFSPPMIASESEPEAPHRQSISQLGLIFGLGLAVTFVFRLVVETFPKILKAQLPTVHPPSLIGIIFITLAIAALPAGLLAARLGNRRIMLVGVGAMAACLGLMISVSSPTMATIAAVGLGASFSLVSNGTLPLVLSLVSPQTAGLAVGLFFSGAAVAVSAFGMVGGLLTQVAVSSPWLGLLMLAIAALCIITSRSR